MQHCAPVEMNGGGLKSPRPSSDGRRRFFLLLLGVLALCSSVRAQTTTTTAATTTAATTTESGTPAEDGSSGGSEDAFACEISFFLTQLTSFDESANTVRAGFWVGMYCNDEDYTASTVPNYITAEEPVVISSATNTSIEGGNIWSRHFVTGLFRVNFDLRRWPFDTQRLRFTSESITPSNFLVLSLHKWDTGIRDTAQIMPGWEVLRVDEEAAEDIFGSELTFNASQGDPNDVVRFYAATYTVVVKRTTTSAYIRGAVSPLAATFFALCLVTLSSKIFPQLAVRVSGTVGAFFSIVISFLGLANTAYMKMMDYIHIFCILVIVSLFQLSLLWTVLFAADVAAERTLMLTDKVVGICLGLSWVVGLLLITVVENTDIGLWVVLVYIVLSNAIFLTFVCFHFKKLWAAYVAADGKGMGNGVLLTHPLRAKYASKGKKGKGEPQGQDGFDPNMSYATELQKVQSFRGAGAISGGGAEKGEQDEMRSISMRDDENESLVEKNGLGEGGFLPFATPRVPWATGRHGRAAQGGGEAGREMTTQRLPGTPERREIDADVDGEGEGEGEADGDAEGDGGDNDGDIV
uniref:Neurotransmitter-gated ion-channel ligand-binding domain-containing protein n=1 Tax=Chromera velia CCMP2878 TaxID=1169474 RepID=A0A0G4HVL6_9ALVE|eukprot:Cvel_1413.t1-p1 / transcript=Cvel_1413.t1 / gene=Cvel_1413 / organism=Chromera_velia_CCMP2878 / gene_product=hypothetical protein / transcript_product=hypothetical protein / location=Cvel_scaffold49:90491-94814(-) / protein_length=578 / sequence_SO=supercontig / SO=protein_coding / is_pseudo=false